MRTLIVLAALTLTSVASADAYRCGVEEPFLDHVIEINLESQRAAIFENAQWLVIKLVAIVPFESGVSYIFEGPRGSWREVVFTMPDMQGTFYTRYEVAYLNQCAEIPTSELKSGI